MQENNDSDNGKYSLVTILINQIAGVKLGYSTYKTSNSSNKSKKLIILYEFESIFLINLIDIKAVKHDTDIHQVDGYELVGA